MENEKEQPLVTRAQARTVYADGRREQSGETVLAEHTLVLTVNGETLARIVCTRTALRELVVGRLCTERLIGSAGDIAELRFTGADAEVILGGKTERRALRRLERAPAWRDEWVFALARRFREGLPLHSETFSTHSAFLMRGGEIVCGYEDISRHNAVDKAVGYALLHDAPLSECMLFTSGRVPADMAEKAIAAGVPILVSKAAATADAIRLAEEYGLTLLTRAREDSYCLSTPAHREFQGFV